MKRMKMTTTTLRYDIPLDLIIQILLRLPAKSVLRFRCVSKSWCSIISGQQFIEAFMSRPPGLVFVLKKGNDEDRVFFFSSPHQSCSLLSSSSSMLLAEKNTLRIPKFKSNTNFIFNSVRGFVCCFLRDRFLVCNPSTGQVIPLSESHNDFYSSSAMYLGYDPNNNQYKVLRLRYGHGPPLIEHSVCTLGGQAERSWRPIKASIPHHFCYRNGVCIDGVVYYAYTKRYLTYTDDPEIILSSFDVESEQLRLIDKPEGCLSGKLTNYLGKLAVYRPLGDVTNVFTLWVLDDVKNQVWSQKTRVFPSLTDTKYLSFRFQGITTSGEIVYVPCPWVSDSFEILCYDVEKSTGRRVTVEGHAGCIKAAVNCSSTTDIYSLGFIPSLLCSYVDNVIYL